MPPTIHFKYTKEIFENTKEKLFYILNSPKVGTIQKLFSAFLVANFSSTIFSSDASLGLTLALPRLMTHMPSVNLKPL